MALSNSQILMIFIFGSMAAISVMSVLQIVYAQESSAPVVRRVEIWSLFYRMMVAAFMVGGAVQGILVYVVIHNRESNPRFKSINFGGSK